MGSSVDGRLMRKLETEGKSSIEGESRRSMGRARYLSKGPRPKLEHLGSPLPSVPFSTSVRHNGGHRNAYRHNACHHSVYHHTC